MNLCLGFTEMGSKLCEDVPGDMLYTVSGRPSLPGSELERAKR